MICVRSAKRAVLYASAGLFLIGSLAKGADSDLSMSPETDLGSFYVRGDIGWSFLEWNGWQDDSAPTVGGGAGYMWNEVLRSDVRLDWSGNYDMTITDLGATTLLGNSYIDIPLDLTFIPYAGAGIGWGWVDNNGTGDESGFTYGLMAGAIFELSNRLALDTGYRFREILLDGSDFTDHLVTAGALFRF
jgi:opacity protein-like surface antigen